VLGLEEYVAAEQRRQEAEKRKKEEAEAAAALGDADAKERVRKTLSAGVLRAGSTVKASSRPAIAANTELISFAEAPLPPRDDAAELDEQSAAEMAGDGGAVAWRRGNRVGLKLRAQVSADVQSGDSALVSFCLRFVYTNTISALEQREIQTEDIHLPVHLNLGEVQGN